MSRAKMPRFTLTILCLAMFVLPTVLATVPVDTTTESPEEGWWVETTVDRDGNGIGDMIEVHQKNPHFLDADKTLPLIIDFSYTPGEVEIQMLEEQVEYQHQWTLEGIDALAGRVPVGHILAASQLPGVVMLELDGILSVTNGDAAVLHGVDTAWAETGYDGQEQRLLSSILELMETTRALMIRMMTHRPMTRRLSLSTTRSTTRV